MAGACAAPTCWAGSKCTPRPVKARELDCPLGDVKVGTKIAAKIDGEWKFARVIQVGEDYCSVEPW